MVRPIAWFWAGLLVGVSFLATPAKFLAPSLDLVTALDVGQHTFGVLQWAEWALLALFVATASLARAPR